MGRERLTSIKPLAAIFIFMLIAFFPRMVPHHSALFLLLSAGLVFIPGYITAGLFGYGAGGIKGAVEAAVTGFAVNFLALALLAALKADVTLLRIVIPVISLALLAAGRILPGCRSGIQGSGKTDPPEGKAGTIALLVIIGVITVIFMTAGDPLLVTSDSPDHISWIRAVSLTHQAFPEGVPYGSGGIETHDIRKGLFHAFIGSVDAMTGRSDPLSAWHAAGWAGSVLFAAALFYAGLLLFGSAAAGALAAALFVVIDHGGLAGFSLVFMATGFFFGKIFYVVFLANMPRLVSRPAGRTFILLAAASLAAAGAHIAHLVILLTACGFIQVSLLVRKKAPGLTLPLLAAAVLAVNAPYLLLRYIRDYAPANPIHTHMQGVLLFTDDLYILNPVTFFGEAGAAGILALLAFFILWRRGRGRVGGPAGEKILLALMAGYYLLVFIPLWFPFLYGRLSYLLIRMEFIVPSILISAWLIVDSIDMLRSASCRRAAISALAVLLAAVVIAAPAIYRSVTSFAYSSAAMEKRIGESAYAMQEVMDDLQNRLDSGSVILSDPVTSYIIPALTDHFIVCPFDQHSAPNDFTAVKRLKACREVYMPGTTPRRIASIMETFGAGLILSSGTVSDRTPTMFWKAGREISAGLSRRLDQFPGSFEKILHSGETSLYRMSAQAGGDTSSAGEGMPSGDAVDRGSLAGMTRAGTKGILISKVALDSETAEAGGTIGMTVTWVATKSPEFDSYVAYVRFDTKFNGGPLCFRIWEKPCRKAIERMRGTRYRFRHDFQPGGGVYPPDTWPLLAEIEDSTLIRVPLNMAPGEYTVSLKLMKRSHYPNYRLSDIMTDDDFYQGDAVARIVIK